MNKVTSSTDLSACAICLENINFEALNNVSIELKCHHFFHEKCVKEWLKIQDSCPTCRVSVEMSKITTEDVLEVLDFDSDSYSQTHQEQMMTGTINNVVAFINPHGGTLVNAIAQKFNAFALRFFGSQ